MLNDGPDRNCTITGLASGAITPVLIIASAASPGTYQDSAAVTATLADPTPADNCAQATLAVTATPAPPAPPCKVIQLAGAPLSIADGALPALNCAVGKPTKQSSKKIHKGLVISTNPGAGATLTAGTVVNIVVSSGPPKKHKKKKKR